MSDRTLHVVAGLGNPGDKYRETRHNVGFFVIDALSSEYAIPLDRRKFDAFYGRGSVKGTEVLLVKPQSYMNRSGIPIYRLIEYFGIAHRDMLVIHDDIDLIYGRIKIKVKGGHGGHNGVGLLSIRWEMIISFVFVWVSGVLRMKATSPAMF